MKALLITGLAVLAVVGMFLGLYRWDVEQNHGLKFGYYREFNRVKEALSSLPGVTVTNEWYNADVTLEEFGFEVTLEAGRKVRLNIQEHDPVSHQSGEPLKHSLAAMIQTAP